MSKSIFLKQLILKNFKGIKDLTIDFSKVTNIYGDNGTGKTTVNDAFTWLLFAKDSQDVSKFSVQPLDESGDIIHMLETEVIGILEIDGIDTALRKVLKEKWVKPKGKPEAELKGTSTDYYINEVPQKEKEYKQKIDEIIPENIFKLLTNPLYFSSILDWKERRKIIFDINGDVSQEDVFNYNSKLLELNKLLNPNESMEDFQKRVKAQISKLKKDQLNIPARVDECSKQKKELDFEALDSNKRKITGELNSIDEKLLDSSKADDEILKQKRKLYDLKDKLMQIEQSAKAESLKPLKELNDKLVRIDSIIMHTETDLTNNKIAISNCKDKIEKLEKEKKELLDKWYSVNDETLTFSDNEFVCPTCGRPFDSTDIEEKQTEMAANFNESKANRLREINGQGKARVADIKKLENDIAGSEKAIDISNGTLKTLQDSKKVIENQINNCSQDVNMDDNAEYQNIKKQIEALETELQQPKDTNLEDLKTKKHELEIDLENVNTQLNFKVHNQELEKRIEELQQKGKDIAQQIADLEKAQYLSDEFTRTKVELLESSINSKFKLAKIKLFENQVNGGLNECCEVMVNGVPFSTNLNSGMRINAGLDIINTLSGHYNVQAPIFIDNKESVTKLIDTNSQIVNLIVSEPDKILRIESEVV